MDLDELARRLWDARLGGCDAIMYPTDHTLTLGDAYLLQQSYVRVSGERQSGWKVGATNADMQADIGLTEPFAGPLLERFTHRSPAICGLVESQPAIVEVEFVLQMGEDFPCVGEPSTTETLANAVESVCAGIEVGSLRYPASMAEPSPALLMADAAGNTGLVHGVPVSDWHNVDLASHEAQLVVNGTRVANGTGGDVLGHPLNALAWLVDFLGRYGLALKRGDLITTGTCTGMHSAKIGDEVVADLGTLGEARVELVAYHEAPTPVPSMRNPGN